MHLISYLTKIHFGAGSRSQLAAEFDLLGVGKPLLVTDKGIVAAGLIDRIRADVPRLSEAPIFDETPENPTEAASSAAAALYRDAGCDAIVAVGGGSPLDLAKAVSLLAGHPEPLAQYAAIDGGVPKITASKPPLIAVPTTAGTGSEVGRAALITLDDGRKLGFISPHMIPTVAICDPELTLGLPARLTAATGMDAITHCIETYISPRYNPPAEAIALDGLARAIRWIRQAVANPQSLEARTEMMMAALQGGLTFQKGLGGVHSLSHPLGGLKEYRLHHGTLNAVLLPHVLRFNDGHIGAKAGPLRAVLGSKDGEQLADAIERLNADLGMPRTLTEMGVSRACFDDVAEAAVLDHSTASNPRPLTAADFKNLLEAAA